MIKNLRLPGGRKLQPRWVGPSRVFQRLNPTAYRLDLEGRFQSLHLIFHISCLKPQTPGGASPAPPELVELEGQLEYKVEDIEGHRKRRKAWQFLVRWAGYSAAHDEWLHEDAL